MERRRRTRERQRVHERDGTRPRVPALHAPAGTDRAPAAQPAAGGRRTVAACPSCAAPLAAADATRCDYCGATVERAAPPPPPSPAELLANRFAALAEHPELPQILLRKPRGESPTGSYGNTLVTAILVVGMGLFGTVMFFQVAGRGVSSVFSLFPLAFAGVGVVMIAAKLSERQHLRHGRLRTEQVLVRDERTAIEGDSKTMTTRYHVTLESPTGRRREYPVAASLAAKVCRGDMGVAFFRDGFLVDVRIVRV